MVKRLWKPFTVTADGSGVGGTGGGFWGTWEQRVPSQAAGGVGQPVPVHSVASSEDGCMGSMKMIHTHGVSWNWHEWNFSPGTDGAVSRAMGGFSFDDV
jgi:hypothetical protein